jgi:hypothetical protein
MQKTRLVLLAALLSTAALVSAVRPAAADCPNSGIACYNIYNPVICRGVVYPNDCYAEQACAQDCRPYHG